MNRKALIIGSLAVGWVGCATPQELIDARNTYHRVSAGPTAQLNPSGLAEAREALDSAEKVNQTELQSGAYYTRPVSDTADLAYIAMRKAEIAEAQANATLAANEKARLTKELEQKAALAQQKADEQREAERRARLAAEKEAADAAAKLANIGSVKQEARGTVLTLAGSIVFTSGQSKLRPDAQAKLQKVATALQSMGGKTFLVEGHTDSVGSDEANLRLSKNRAEAVRGYLISHGVNQEQIRAVGLGKTRPVAENDTPAGRASNRRVEIIIQSNPS